MHASDFIQGKSVHELLYLIFASEIGLLGVSHPLVQLEAIAHSFEPLRNRLMATQEQDVFVPLLDDGSLTIPWAKDGHLFALLFRNIDTVPADQVLSRHVYPLIGEMVQGTPALKNVVSMQLRRHVQQYGSAVGERIANDLIKFDLAELAIGLQDHATESA